MDPRAGQADGVLVEAQVGEVTVAEAVSQEAVEVLVVVEVVEGGNTKFYFA